MTGVAHAVMAAREGRDGAVPQAPGCAVLGVRHLAGHYRAGHHGLTRSTIATSLTDRYRFTDRNSFTSRYRGTVSGSNGRARKAAQPEHVADDEGGCGRKASHNG